MIDLDDLERLAAAACSEPYTSRKGEDVEAYLSAALTAVPQLIARIRELEAAVAAEREACAALVESHTDGSSLCEAAALRDAAAAIRARGTGEQ